MREILTEIDIDAPPRRVWAVLTAFDAYGEWNPFIRSLRGDAREGARLAARIEPPGGRAMTFRPTVLRADPDRELRWRGRLLVPGLFDGEHRFAIEALPHDRSRFRQEERFRGLLVPALARALTRTRTGFEEMNAALRDRAEALRD